jgi:hypothetical protein
MSRPKLVVAVAFVAAVVGAFVASFAPTYSSGASTYDENGSSVFVVVSVPIVLTLIPLLVGNRTARIVCAVVLWLGCVVAMFSVGIFFIPAAIVLTIAAVVRDPVSTSPG